MITSNTLFNIRRHSSLVMRLANYMVEAGDGLFYNKIHGMSERSNELELIEAFDDDLKKTVKKIENIHQLLSTVNDDDVVLHLKEETNLKVIFGDAYDSKEKTIKLPHFTLDLKVEVSKDDLLDKLLKGTIGLDLTSYKEMMKARKNIFKYHKEELYNIEEKLDYLSSEATREMYKPAIDKIKAMVDSNVEFRKSLSVEEKTVIDEEIIFTKAMVDAVAKQSLYITAEGGIEQWGSGFKRDHKEKAEAIRRKLRNHPYVEAVEIDKDTDIEAFIQLLDDVEKLNLNIQEKTTLKSRKLGNLKINGCYIHSYNIVALDVTSPAAAIHEFVHLIDDQNKDILMSETRSLLAGRLRERLPMSIAGFKDSKFRTTTEIIARAGELSYVLSKYNYKPREESFETFSNRAKEAQKQKSAYDLRIEPSIERLSEKSDLFFDLETMTPGMIETIQAYYSSYFKFNNKEALKPIFSVELPPERKHTVVKKEERFKRGSLSYVNSDNIKEIMNNNEKLKLADPEEIVKIIFEKSTEIGRTKKELSNKDLRLQSEVWREMSEWAFENDNHYVMSRMIENMYKLHSEAGYLEFGLFDAARNNPDLVINSSINDEAKNLKEAINPLREKTSFDQEDKKHFDKLVEETIKQPAVIRVETSHKSELTDELIEKHRISGAIHRNSLNSIGYSNRFRHVSKMFIDTIRKDGDKIFNYFSKDDLAPYLATLQSEKNYETLEKRFMILNSKDYERSDFKNAIFSNRFLSILDHNGVSPELVDVSNRVHIDYSFEFNKVSTGYDLLSEKHLRKVDFIAVHGFNDVKTSNIGVKITGEKDLTIEKIKERVVALPDYDSTQLEVEAIKSTYKKTISSEELKAQSPLQTFIENTKEIIPKEDGIALEESKAESSLKELIESSNTITPKEDKTVLESKVDTSPIDPNEVIKDNKKKKSKRYNKNQGLLF